MRLPHVVIFLVICFPALLYGQKKQGEKYINDLTSADFKGRGYTNDSDKKAAKYIADLFEKFGVKSFGDTYFQSFELNINTFPNNVQVSLNGDTLQTGADFIIDPSSGPAHGTYSLVRITPDNFQNRESIIQDNLEEIKNGKIAVVVDHGSITNRDSMLDYYEFKYQVSTVAPVIWINNDKLTWGASRSIRNKPIIEIADSVLGAETSEIYLNIEPEYKEAYKTQNVIGYIPASTKKGQKHYKVITAHYDHLGEMGNTAFIPGANDNASGTSMLLNLTAYYAQNPSEDFNVVFIAFGAEEAGLVGSLYYTNHPVFPLKKIDFLLNLDLLGTGEDGITVVNATLHEDAFNLLVEINNQNDYLVKIGKRGEAANSDHYYFSKKGVPAFFIYTRGGIKAYHDIYDRSETLPLTEYNDLYEMLIKFLKDV